MRGATNLDDLDATGCICTRPSRLRALWQTTPVEVRVLSGALWSALEKRVGGRRRALQAEYNYQCCIDGGKFVSAQTTRRSAKPLDSNCCCLLD
jgi:hypothetical protein